MKKAYWFIFFLLLAISCLDEPDCFRLNNNLIGVAFKKMLDGEADTVALIGVQASGTDSVFSELTLTTGVYLPLDFFTRETSFTIQGLYGKYVLSLRYNVQTQFVSDECGARYVLSDLEMISNDFDSLRMVSATPSSSEAGVHVEVYRCPRTHLIELSFRQLQGDESVVSAIKINSLNDDYSGLLYADTTLSTVYLPVNQAANTTKFDFRFADGINNTITVNYTREAKEFFEVCGGQQIFYDLTVNDDFDFDSLSMVSDSLQDPPVTNINAYRCPTTNLVQVYFRQPAAVRADTISLTKVTDNYSTNAYYQGEEITYALLPLNDQANQTEFTFELADGTTKKLKFQYTTTQKVLFNACETQTLFSDLKATTEDPFKFNSAVIKADSVTFPTQTNVEIIIK